MKNNNSLFLKQVVTVNVIVTEEFKRYLLAELQIQMNALSENTQQIEAMSNHQISHLVKQGRLEQADALQQQLLLGKQNAVQTVNELKKRAEEVNDLKIGSLFTQGAIEGLIELNEGDNLYKKLGGMQIIIKDGVIQQIKD